MKDLFGRDLTLAEAEVMVAAGRKKRKTTQARGYAALPGTGPAGETCKTCKHITRRGGGSRHYLKCGLMARHWTGGPGSDIRARSPACRNWEADVEGDD